MTDIFLARHGETESNRAGLWQGVTDSSLTSNGETQVARLAERLRSRPFDAIVSSDLGRAVTTATALDREFTTSAAWREPDLGVWEGKTYDEVQALSPDALAGFIRGDDVRLGNAERLSETSHRLLAAYRSLVEEVGPDGSALVVTHGLAIAVLTGALLDTRRPNPLALPGNTGLVHLVSGPKGDRLDVHNDHSHLTEAPITHRATTEVVFIRHGQTVSNVEGRWQGQQDGSLTDEGRMQAKEAATGLPELDYLYTSRLGRAVDTAEIIGAAIGLTPIVVDGVEELGFGTWEGLTRAEIRRRDPEEAARVFDDNDDIPRGGHGETWAGLVERIERTVAELVERHEGGRIGIVSHGATTRAFVDRVLDVESHPARRVATLRNTAYASFGITRHGTSPHRTRVMNWNIAPHLDR